MRPRHNPWLKKISTVLVFSFAFQQISYAAPGVKPSQIDLFEKPSVHFRFPESIATIEDAYKAPQGDRMVILMQDAHTNESGQLNLAKALDVILKQIDKDHGSWIMGSGKTNNPPSTIQNLQSSTYVFLEAGLG